MSGTNECAVCSIPTDKKCSKCKTVFYCCRKHQTSGWENHKDDCKPYTVCLDSKYGRYVTATKPFQVGDIILTQLPLVSSPGEELLSDTTSVCPSCLMMYNIKNSFLCERCGWPLCSRNCSNNPIHFPECSYAYLRQENVSVREALYCQLKGFILVLRCLYQKKFKPEIWNKLYALSRTCEKDVRSEYHERIWAAMKYIYETFKLKDHFEEELVESMLKVVLTRSFEHNVDNRVRRAIYEVSGLFEHSCKANCQVACNTRGLLRIVAALPIAEGDHLTISYINPLLTTSERQHRIQYLQISHISVCHCVRCTNVTEFGTNFSALKCQKSDCDGIVLPESFLIKESLWVCGKCQENITIDRVVQIYDTIADDFSEAKQHFKFKIFLDTHASCLPSTHYFMITAKLYLMRTMVDLDNLSNEEIMFKMHLCQEMADVLLVLAPALKRTRGEILFHLQNALQKIFIRKIKPQTYSKEDAVNVLQERKYLLEEVVSCLRYELGSIYRRANAHLKEIEEAFQKLNL